MREIKKPPVNFKKLHIDDIDPLDAPRHHHKQVRAMRKGLVGLIIFLVALALVAGGLLTYMYLLKNNPSLGTPSTDTSQTEQNTSITAKSLIAKAKVLMRGDVKEKTLSNDDSLVSNVFSAPPFRPKGYNFSVHPSIDYGFASSGNKNTVTGDMVYIQKVLVDNGLSEKILDPGSDVGQFAANYESASIICILTDQKPSDPNGIYSTTIGCANISDYLANAAMLRPYFIVYASQARTDTSKTLLGTPIYQASRTPGYSIATVAISGSEYGGVGGFAGLFYVTPDNSLHYFKGTQNILPCSDYTTADLQKAYLGEQCYDTETNNGQATVKLSQ